MNVFTLNLMHPFWKTADNLCTPPQTKPNNNKTKQQQNTTQHKKQQQQKQNKTKQNKTKQNKDNKQTLYWPQAVDLCDDVRRG